MRGFIIFLLVAGIAGFAIRIAAPPGPAPVHAACRGVTEDDAEAEKFRAAALKGDAVAQYETGRMFLYGRDGLPDRETARLWFEKAAQQGNMDAQFELGRYYSFVGPKRMLDPEKAAAYYKQAAEQGHSAAMSGLSNVLGGFDMGLSEKVTPTREQESALWSTRVYLHGLGLVYHIRDNPFDATQMALFFKAAEAGDAKAQFSYGVLQMSGIGVEKNEAEGKRWVEKAAAQNYGPAWNALSRGLKGDERRKMLEKAVAAGYVEPINFLTFGDPSPQAAERLKQAVDAGDPGAMLELGRRYWEGRGVETNRKKAYELLVRASKDREAVLWAGLEGDCDHYARELK